MCHYTQCIFVFIFIFLQEEILGAEQWHFTSELHPQPFFYILRQDLTKLFRLTLNLASSCLSLQNGFTCVLHHAHLSPVSSLKDFEVFLLVIVALIALLQLMYFTFLNRIASFLSSAIRIQIICKFYVSRFYFKSPGVYSE